MYNQVCERSGRASKEDLPRLGKPAAMGRLFIICPSAAAFPRGQLGRRLARELLFTEVTGQQRQSGKDRTEVRSNGILPNNAIRNYLKDSGELDVNRK